LNPITNGKGNNIMFLYHFLLKNLHHFRNLLSLVVVLLLANTPTLFAEETKIQDPCLTLAQQAHKFQESKDYEKALALYEQVLEIQSAPYISIVQCESDEKIVDFAHHQMGKIYEAQKHFDEAEQAFLKSLNLQEKMYGADSEKIIHMLDHLASLYQTQKNYDKLISFYQHILAIREKELNNKLT